MGETKRLPHCCQNSAKPEFSGKSLLRGSHSPKCNFTTVVAGGYLYPQQSKSKELTGAHQSQLRKGKKVHTRFWNCTSHPVALKATGNPHPFSQEVTGTLSGTTRWERHQQEVHPTTALTMLLYIHRRWTRHLAKGRPRVKALNESLATSQSPQQ